MSEVTQTPVAEETPVESKPTDVKSEAKASPAQELREIQHLLLGGIFPGNVAPAVVKGYQLLEKMCVDIEASVAK